MSDDTKLNSIVEPPPLVADVNDANTTPRPPPVPRLNLAALDEISRADPALFEDRRADPPFSRQVMTTPLHFYVASESLTNLWCNWNGYTVADQLTSLDDEYAALRHGAALADISPLVKYRISGPDALAWLRRLVTGNLVSLSVDEIIPVVFCEDRGLVVGDGLLFRLGDSEFRLVTEERHLAWFMDSAIGHNVRIEDVSKTLAAMSLQGPLSCAVLSEAGFSGIENLRCYTAHWFNVTGMPVYVSRSGNSGDLGYELWVDPDDAPAFWLRLLDKGKAYGVKAGGFALREIARIEAGIPRAGVDYLGAFSAVDPQSALTPFELGFSALVDLNGEHFTGREALRKAKTLPPRYILATLAVDWSAPLTFAAIRDGSGVAGIATSTGFSHALGINLALATLRPAAIADGAVLHVQAEVREELSLRVISAAARILAGPAVLLPARHLVPAPLVTRR
ncbi:MAG: aminomethyltransferase family protein [Parvibaculum sp.]|nr:aminomethyltransferase family protein [Parvibaculum sp.]